MKKQILIYALIIILFGSCDAVLTIDGRVLSHRNKLPITGATVELVGENDSVKTDQNGYFHIEKISGFSIEPVIRVTAGNYKPFEIEMNHSCESKSYKVNNAFIDVDFDKPVYRDSNNFIVSTSVKKYSGSFTIDNDTLLLYLDTMNINAEIEQSKQQFTSHK